MSVITPPLITAPFAYQGDVSVVPPTDPNGFVNFANGYTPDYEINLGSGDPQAKAVERGIQNWLFNALTTAMQAWQTSNRPPWYSSFPGGYAKAAEVVYPDANGVPVPYRSLVNGNVATPGGSTNWEYIQGSGEMIQNIPMPSGGTGGPGVMLINQATDFNTLTTSGTFQFQSDAIVSGSPNSPSNGGNAGAAGMLEITAWKNGANNYYTQFYRDRNGLGFMRGGTNGTWSVWKIWANASQFVVGEIRMWYGAPTDVAVQAAYGPGWHVCNGNNGTPNMGNVFPIGASSTLAQGSTGGAFSQTLNVGNLPSHSHVIVVTDNGHAHAVYDPGHAHGVNDPGHAHGVYDPGHAHSMPNGGVGQAGADNGGITAISPPNGYGARAAQGTYAAGTGIAIYGNGTGIGIYAAGTGIGIYNANTNITAAAQNTGSGNSFSITPPYFAVTFVMYTGA